MLLSGSSCRLAESRVDYYSNAVGNPRCHYKERCLDLRQEAVNLVVGCRGISCGAAERLELAALHLFEKVLALDVGIIVLRRRQRLVVSAALARLRQLLGLGRVLPYQLG